MPALESKQLHFGGRRRRRAILGLFSAILLLAQSSAFARMIVVHPKPSDELFANPGMGWQTFHRFADDDPNLQGLPSSSAYFRFYWREVEPEPGQVDFKRFDELLAHAHRAGQRLAFRIMCTGSSAYLDVPEWLKQQGCRGIEFEYGGKLHWVPDFADPKFQKAHFDMIRQLGRRYDRHPDLDLVDIGTVGLWGEWHMSQTKAAATGQPVPLPSWPVQWAIIEAWVKAFPNTPKVLQIGAGPALSQASIFHCGWRADCLGDMGGFSKTWNHMQNFYRQQLQQTGAENLWQKYPVAFESCWDMRKWASEGWDIRYIFNYALDCHASYLNNKSAPIPPGTRPEIEHFLRRLGYRLTAKTVRFPDQFVAGDPFMPRIEWENQGVAPPYIDAVIAYRFRNSNGESFVIGSGLSIRGWKPGRLATGDRYSVISEGWRIPRGASPGEYQFSIGVADRTTRRPKVRLAIEGRDSEGWYPIGAVRIVPGRPIP